MFRSKTISSTISILLLIIIGLVVNMTNGLTAYDRSDYSIPVEERYPTLLDIKGQRLLLIKLYPASEEATINTVSIFCENTLLNLAIRTMDLRDDKDFKNMLGRVVEYRQRFIEKYGVWYKYVKYEKAYVVYTSLGYMYYVYGDGEIRALRILGANFSNILSEKILDLRLYDVNYTVEYGGISGHVIKEVIGYKGVKTENGSVIIQGKSTYTVYEEPFEKYYITIYGVRIAYSLKIGVEATEHGSILKYFEGFLPYGWIDKEIIVDDKLLRIVVDEYSKATSISVKNPNELVVLDIYYAITPDKVYLAPMIVVTKNNTNSVALIALYGDKAKTIHTMTTTGDYHPSDPEITLLETILEDSKNQNTKHYSAEHFLLIGLIATPIIILSYIVLRKTRTSK